MNSLSCLLVKMAVYRSELYVMVSLPRSITKIIISLTQKNKKNYAYTWDDLSGSIFHYIELIKGSK